MDKDDEIAVSRNIILLILMNAKVMMMEVCDKIILFF